jgi:hypothetical protein
MNHRYASAGFSSSVFENGRDGCTGIDLFHTSGEHKQNIARVTFWDATGQFVLETYGEVPLILVEDLIAEAKQTIKLK